MVGETEEVLSIGGVVVEAVSLRILVEGISFIFSFTEMAGRVVRDRFGPTIGVSGAKGGGNPPGRGWGKMKLPDDKSQWGDDGLTHKERKGTKDKQRK